MSSETEIVTDELDTEDLAAAMLEDEGADDTSPDGDEQAITEAVESLNAKAEAETPALQPGQDRGDGRDITGKWVARNAEGEAIPEPVTEEPPPALEPLPFVYKGAGQKQTFEGAVIRGDGVVEIAADKVPELRMRLANAAQFQAETYPRVQRLEQENRELKESRSLTEQRAEQLVTALESALTAPTEEDFLTAVYTLREQYPTLKMQAEAQFWREQAQKGLAPQPPTPQVSTPSAAPERAVAEQAVVGVYEAMQIELASSPQYRPHLTDADWQQIGAKVGRNPYAYVRPATADEAPKYGVQVGEFVLDTDLLHADVQDALSAMLTQRQAAQAAKAAQQAGKFNAGAVKATTKAPTPAPRAVAPDVKAKPVSRQDEFRRFRRDFLSSPGLPGEDDED